MYQKRFLLGSQPQIRITGVAGDIEISGQEGEEIRLETDVLGDVNTKDNILLLEGIAGDLRLQVPRGAHIALEGVSGDVKVQNVTKIEVQGITGEIEVEHVEYVNIEGMANSGSGGIIARLMSRVFPFNWRSSPRKEAVSNRTPSPKESLESEQLAILRMLQEKKITAEEAEKLLDALGKA